MKRRRVLGFAILVPVAMAHCSSAASHPYAARRWDPVRGCVERTTTIDVVDGPEAANCEAICMIGGALDGGAGVFTSLMCPPFPPGYDTTGKDPRCKPALDAFLRGDGCLADGGSQNALEAGPDALSSDATAE